MTEKRNVGLGAGGAEVSQRVVDAVVAATRGVLGGWPDGARTLMESLAGQLGVRFDLGVRADPRGDRLVDALRNSPALGVQALRVVIAASMMDGRPSRACAARVARLAARLDVDVPALTDLRLLAEGKLIRLRFHVMWRFWAVDLMRRRVRELGWWYLFKTLLITARLFADPGLAARYRALSETRPGSLGHAYLDFVERNHFTLHGTRGSFPELIVHHDLSHVLAGYGTDPASEVQAACFQAGYRQQDPFAIVMFVMLQFHLGVRMTPAAKGQVGNFDPDRALDAIRRGIAMNRDLTDGEWDYWADLARPIDEVRARYNVPPAGAIRRAA